MEPPPLSATIPDAELVQACRTGDTQAWAMLVQRFSRYVHAIAIQAYRLSPHEAEDVFQEVFARAYEHLGKLRSDEAIRPWLGQLTRRLSIDRLRQTRRERSSDEEIEAVEVEADGELEQIELAVLVHAAMAGLPDNCREILDRFFARDESYSEIADALEIPMGTVASRISRCLVRLRTEISESPA
jgi:RNA polymerase sigma factor (sigma-70 family)